MSLRTFYQTHKSRIDPVLWAALGAGLALLCPILPSLFHKPCELAVQLYNAI